MRGKSLALAALLLAAVAPAPAQGDAGLADLVEKVAPSVVNLHTSGVRQGRSYWDAFFGGPRRWESLGSGFVVDAHVVPASQRAEVARAFEALKHAGWFHHDVVTNGGTRLGLTMVRRHTE